MNVVVHVFHASNMLIGVVGLPGEKTGAVFLAPKSQGVSVVEMCLKALLSFLKRSTPTSIIRLNHSATQTKLSTSPSASAGQRFRTWNDVLLKYSVNETH